MRASSSTSALHARPAASALRPSASVGGWQGRLSGELQKERRRCEALYTFAQEGEEAAQETLSDLACERALRSKANARVAQLEDLLDDRERNLEDAFLELRELRERLFAKDLHVQDLEECLRVARAEQGEAQDEANAENARLAARLSNVEQSAASQARLEADRFAEMELREDEALRDLARERSLRISADSRIDELDRDLESHGQEMEGIVGEFQALHDDISARDDCIQSLEGRLRAAGENAGEANGNCSEWQTRCVELRSVLSEVESAARARASGHEDKLLIVEGHEMRLAAKLEASESSAQRALSRTQDLASLELEKDSLHKDVSRMQRENGHFRRDAADLRAELAACRAELSDAHACRASPSSPPRTHAAPSSPPRTHRDTAEARTELVAYAAELAACRAELASCRDQAAHSREASAALVPQAAPRTYVETQPLAPIPAASSAVSSVSAAHGARAPRCLAQAQAAVASAPSAEALLLDSYQAELASERGQKEKSFSELADARRRLHIMEIEKAHLEGERFATKDRALSQPIPRHADLSMAFADCAEDLDVDVAVHAAALNVAVRAELEAARKAGHAEAVQARACDLATSCPSLPQRGEQYGSYGASLNRRDSPRPRRDSDVRVQSLASELQAEQSWSSQATDALELSTRALREEQRVASDLRSQLDAVMPVFTAPSCAASRAAQANRAVQSAWELEGRLEAPPVRASAKRARGKAVVQAAAEAAAVMHQKSLYRKATSPGRHSSLRMRIEEEARLRIQLGLYGSTT